MKIVLLGVIAATIISVRPASAANAYDAMRVVGTSNGEAILETITEVRGSRGTPQPVTWKISTKATTYEVRLGKITSTSAGRALAPLNLSDLKLDSDGAHTVAEREAKKAAFAYDFADYALRTGAKSTPVWEVRLVDEASNSTAVLNIGADTGKVISSEGLGKKSTPSKPPVAQQPPSKPKHVEQDPADYAPADEPPPKPRREPEPRHRYAEDEDASDDSRYNQGYEKVIDRVGEHLKLRGREFRSWFDRNVLPGGRPTYGSSGRDRYEEERPVRRQPERRDPNETRYYQPAPGERLRD